MIRCADESLYTGITTDVDRRFREHSEGRGGAKYLRGRGPLQLAWQAAVGDRGTASRLEYRIKRLSAEMKRALCASATTRAAIIAEVTG
jgi:putative endonuclease